MSALPRTSDDFLRLVERSGLITPESLSRQAHSESLPSEAMPCARQLVKTGLLTSFQAEQLLQGKSRGFFLGNYRVLQRLGGGATAGVFLCEHKLMKHRVAVKVLCQLRQNEDANLILRFRREARAAAALSHPNIVRTIDLDEHEGRHFLVMEYVEGVTLGRWMEKNPNAPLRVYVHFALQAAIGLQHIHEAGLIHRDFKPANLLIDRQGIVKILDLGLAKFTDDSLQDGLSAMGGKTIMGTVDFMSPEQADGDEDLDIRGDIYGLGATLYFLLTGGQVPFPANGLGAKMIAIHFQQPKPIREFRSDADPLLEKIVARMMAKERDKRFQTPKEAITILHSWLNRTDSKKPGTITAESVQAASNALHDTKINRRTVILKAAAKAAPRPPAKPKSVQSKRSRVWKWSLRAVACGVLLSSIFLLKPWNIGHRAVAQATDAPK